MTEADRERRREWGRELGRRPRPSPAGRKLKLSKREREKRAWLCYRMRMSREGKPLTEAERERCRRLVAVGQAWHAAQGEEWRRSLGRKGRAVQVARRRAEQAAAGAAWERVPVNAFQADRWASEAFRDLAAQSGMTRGEVLAAALQALGEKWQAGD